MSTASQKLAKWVSDLEYKNIPKDIIKSAKNDVLDMFGCGLFGSTRPWVKVSTDLVKEWGGKDEATLWGHDVMVPCVNAVLANAHAINAFEFDDTYFPWGIHPGALVVTSALAAAEMGGEITGKKFVEAVVAGHEVSARVRCGLGWSVLHGRNSTALCSTFGAAAASGKILNLNESEITNAFGICGPYVGGLLTYGFKAMAKRIVNGRSAQGGIMAALLARNGFTGYQDILESEQGGFCESHSSDPDIERITQGLGNKFEMTKLALKKYPTCTSFHAALDALSEIVDENDLDTNRIEKVIIRTTRGALKNNVGTNYDNISSAQMSMEYSVAAKIVDGKVGINQFTPARIQDLTLREMAGKVETVIDPELDALGLDHRFAAQAIVLLDDKTRFESDYVHNPKRMTTESVESKFITLANTAVNEEQGREIIESVDSIEKMRDVSNLADLLTVRSEE